MPKWDKLTPKLKKFSDNYIQNWWNWVQAVLSSYDTNNPRTASVMAVENLARPSVQAYLADKWREAWSRIEELAKKSEREDIKLKANMFIYEQAVWKAVQKTEISWKDWWAIHIATELTEDQKRIIAGLYTKKNS